MPFPTAHALLIGISSYAYAPQFRVPNAAADASAVDAVLRDPQLCGYPSGHVALLSEAAASREGCVRTQYPHFSCRRLAVQRVLAAGGLGACQHGLQGRCSRHEPLPPFRQ